MTPFEDLLQSITASPVIIPEIPYTEYVPLDLSSQNPELQQFDSTDASQMEKYIQELLKEKKGAVAYGGYLEKRLIYQRSPIFKAPGEPERNIHLGIDLWTQAGASVHAALEGEVHSFNYNNGTGNYGPTILLKHQLKNDTFYTLYGHLSLQDIERLELGVSFKKGEQIGHLGDPTENGDYAPHLHFQIIHTTGEAFGDYPGVCSENDLSYYSHNCPDPNLLLKIKNI